MHYSCDAALDCISSVVPFCTALGIQTKHALGILILQLKGNMLFVLPV